MREGDAEPDEIAVIPDEATASSIKKDGGQRSPIPGGQPIPKTVVEETADTSGSVTHPEIEKKHRADPPPDLVLKANGMKVNGDSEENGTDV
jgi:hypothetical protein